MSDSIGGKRAFNLLIVEDEAEVARELQRQLKAALPNAQLDVAESHNDASRLIQQRANAGSSFDVAILDIKLPNELGEEPRLNAAVYRGLRSLMPNALVIHTTAYPKDPEVMEFILNETMRSSRGPRSVFLPRTDPAWTSEILETVRGLDADNGKDIDAAVTCFISYSHKDEAFVAKLYQALKNKNVDVWFAPARMKAGVKLYEEIERNVRLYDKFLLVISENSINSQWVNAEIRIAFDEEIRSNVRKLMPIRLVDFAALLKWKCFNADLGRDMAAELREYFIPNFRGWRRSNKFERSVEELYGALLSNNSVRREDSSKE